MFSLFVPKTVSINTHLISGGRTDKNTKKANYTNPNKRITEEIIKEKGISTSLDITRVVSSIKERANFITEFWDLADYFFVTPTSYDEKAAKNWKEETPELMKQVLKQLQDITDFSSLNIETLLKEWMTTNEIGMGKVMQPLRLSLVGALKGPHLFDIIELIGKAETASRIETAIATL